MTRRKRKPPFPYWACLLLWAATGPLGAGPAGCGRWGRACFEAALTLGGIWLAFDALAVMREDGQWAVAEALSHGEISPGRLIGSAIFLCMGMALWVSDYWRMKHWHSIKADPLLDTTTQSD